MTWRQKWKQRALKTELSIDKPKTDPFGPWAQGNAGLEITLGQGRQFAHTNSANVEWQWGSMQDQNILM